MQSNTGNQGQGNMKFVPRFEMAVMQYVILSKAQQQGGVTRDNLQQTFRGNLQMTQDHLQHCIQQLVSDGHLKEQGNKFVISDDGREDIQKLQHLVLELPNVVNQGGMQQKSGQTQTATTGGAGAGSPRSGGMGNPGGTMGGTTGSTIGQGSTSGTGTQQGKPMMQNEGQRETTKESGNKGGATQAGGSGGQSKGGV